MNKTFAYKTLPALVLSSLAVAQAHAETVTTLAPIYGTASYRESAEEKAINLTPNVDRFSREKLEANNIQSWQDFGSRLDPSVTFNESNKSINIRGLDEHRVKVFKDGVPMPYLNDGARGTTGGVEQVNFDTLSKIDVVKGPGQGASGIGGTVDLSTLSPSDLLRADRDIGFLGKTLFSGYDDSISVTGAGAFRLGDKTRLLLEYGHKNGHEEKNEGDIGGLGPERTKVNPKHYHQNNFMARIEQDLAQGHRLDLGYEMLKRDSSSDAKSEQGTKNYNEGNKQNFSKAENQRAWGGYHFKALENFSPVSSLSVVGYWQRTKLNEGYDAFRNKANDKRERMPQPNIRPDGTYSMNFRDFRRRDNPFGYGYPYGNFDRDNETKNTSWGVNLNADGYFGDSDFYSKWQAGFNWNRKKDEQFAGGEDNCPPLPKLRGGSGPFGPATCNMLHKGIADSPKVLGDDISAYLDNTFAWNNAMFRVTPGVQFDWYRRKPSAQNGFGTNSTDGSPDDLTNVSDHRFSPRVLLEFSPTLDWNIYGKYSYGYRAPQTEESYLKYGAMGSYINKGNPNLEAERSRGFDVGVAYDNGVARAKLNYFNTLYSNYIESQVPFPEGSYYDLLVKSPENPYPLAATTYANIDKVRLYGLEFSAGYNFTPEWSVDTAVAWTVGKNKEDNTYLNSVSPVRGTVNLAYTTNTWGANALLEWSAKRSKVQNKDEDFRSPGYAILNLGAFISPQEVLKGLKIQANVMNVFDKKYWKYSDIPTSGTSMRDLDLFTARGRHAMLSVSYQY
ncbi:TonB-dependent hemoglobin/transferrin/lactoferrin family receptor [Brackiella oedipodis]|uniref:TonB-dependent hemoglobin/transferrin/lactoferrin family receptor n=1 Tax=Brackiella oedipodis TaxID=124225 RepID=UPI00146FABF2|nr:TonB-dependent hemoglobin/transferrin/lactoferrin family receptor [Brackiella oedipodis]